MQKNISLLNVLLEKLNDDKCVDEILIIDNSTKGFKGNFSKVKTIVSYKNLFVNPSWNLGIKNIKNDYFAIFNDDLVIPDNFCSKILSLLDKKNGLIGIDRDFIETLDNVLELPNEDLVPFLIETKERNLHWGTIIMGHKNSYYQIPDNILIWCGDDYLFKMNLKNNKKNYKLSNCYIKHIHGFTSLEDRFFRIKYNDCKNMKKYFSEFQIPKQFSLIKRIKRKFKQSLGH